MIPCKLVHDTGTMVRFRPSQLPLLPDESVDVDVLLPTGAVVRCHFNRHPKNPYLGGAALVRYIKKHVAWKELEDVLLERRSTSLWALHRLSATLLAAAKAGVSKKTITSGEIDQADFDSLVSLGDEEQDRGQRLVEYRRILRPAGLRRLVLQLMGARCMAEGCEAHQHFSSDWGPESEAAIVEVHHVEEVARTNDHSPKNLVVLCANHHSLVHGLGQWIVEHDGPDVIMSRDGKKLVLRRPKWLVQNHEDA